MRGMVVITMFTANIFFNFLLDAMPKRYHSGDSYRNNREYFTQTDMFSSLTKIILCDVVRIKGSKKIKCDECSQGNENDISKFKYGKLGVKNSSIYLFNNQVVVNSFSAQIKNNYQNALQKMIDFAERYLS